MVILQLEEQPPLIQAIITGEVEEVKALLEGKEDANYQDGEKRCPLHAAAFKGDVEICALLLSHGARVNTKDSKWLTPLHRACCSGSEETVSLLLRYNADTSARDRQWQTPLHIAASNNAVECVAQLLNQVPNPNVTDRYGRTALHHAAINGHNDVVELLLSKGCIVNACDKKDNRPLHFAAHMGHVDTIECLINYSADLNAKDRNQYTPLHVAAASGMVSATRLLLNYGADINSTNAYGNTPLHIACLNGHLAVCEELVAYKADIESVNYRGMTPLHIAAACTHGADCLNFLLERKVNINRQNIDGRTPLHMTAIHGRFTRSKYLIDKGAIVDATDKNGCTALHIAAQFGHELLSNTLLYYGADVNKKGFEGRSPLHMACLSGFVECCRKLIQASVDLNSLDDYGRTCIHYAALKGSVDCIDLLVSSGASFQTIDTFGRTPLHYASSQGQFNCIFTLVGVGANVNLADNEGCTALHLAAAYDGDGRCVEYLLEHKADSKFKDKNGYSAIHYAAAGSNFAALGFLLEAVGKNYQLAGPDMPLMTPLHIAAKNGNQDILRLILPYFHDVNIKAQNGATPLLLAAKQGHTHCVQMLLRFGAKVAIYDANQMSSVHYSAKNGHLHSLALLVDNTEDKSVVNIQDNFQRSPLMLAVTGGHLDCVSTLLKSNANPNICDSDYHTSIFRAVVGGQANILQLLIQSGAEVGKTDKNGKTILHLAAACGHFHCLQIILQHMSANDALIYDKQNCSALHWACYNGNPNCVEFLLKMNIFTKLEGNLFSPIHCASINGSRKCLELLCNHYGAEIVKLKDCKKRTPLHIIALNGHTECGRFLLEQKAEIDCQDEDGRTPLIAAAQNGEIGVIDLLISHKADLTLYDNNGNTALHLACLKKHSHTALLLLEYITDVDIINMVNNEKKTALHLAARNGLVEVTRHLILKGSSVIAQDANGMTPALCCAPNPNVAQCLSIIMASYPKPSSFDVNYPPNDNTKEKPDTPVDSLYDKQKVPPNSPNKRNKFSNLYELSGLENMISLPYQVPPITVYHSTVKTCKEPSAKKMKIADNSSNICSNTSPVKSTTSTVAQPDSIRQFSEDFKNSKSRSLPNVYHSCSVYPKKKVTLVSKQTQTIKSMLRRNNPLKSLRNSIDNIGKPDHLDVCFGNRGGVQQCFIVENYSSFPESDVSADLNFLGAQTDGTGLELHRSKTHVLLPECDNVCKFAKSNGKAELGRHVSSFAGDYGEEKDLEKLDSSPIEKYNEETSAYTIPLKAVENSENEESKITIDKQEPCEIISDKDSDAVLHKTESIIENDEGFVCKRLFFDEYVLKEDIDQKPFKNALVVSNEISNKQDEKPVLDKKFVGACGLSFNSLNSTQCCFVEEKGKKDNVLPDENVQPSVAKSEPVTMVEKSYVVKSPIVSEVVDKEKPTKHIEMEIILQPVEPVNIDASSELVNVELPLHVPTIKENLPKKPHSFPGMPKKAHLSDTCGFGNISERNVSRKLQSNNENIGKNDTKITMEQDTSKQLVSPESCVQEVVSSQDSMNKDPLESFKIHRKGSRKSLKKRERLVDRPECHRIHKKVSNDNTVLSLVSLDEGMGQKRSKHNRSRDSTSARKLLEYKRSLSHLRKLGLVWKPGLSKMNISDMPVDERKIRKDATGVTYFFRDEDVTETATVEDLLNEVRAEVRKATILQMVAKGLMPKLDLCLQDCRVVDKYEQSKRIKHKVVSKRKEKRLREHCNDIVKIEDLLEEKMREEYPILTADPNFDSSSKDEKWESSIEFDFPDEYNISEYCQKVIESSTKDLGLEELFQRPKSRSRSPHKHGNNNSDNPIPDENNESILLCLKQNDLPESGNRQPPVQASINPKTLKCIPGILLFPDDQSNDKEIVVQLPENIIVKGGKNTKISDLQKVYSTSKSGSPRLTKLIAKKSSDIEIDAPIDVVEDGSAISLDIPCDETKIKTVTTADLAKEKQMLSRREKSEKHNICIDQVRHDDMYMRVKKAASSDDSLFYDVNPCKDNKEHLLKQKKANCTKKDAKEKGKVENESEVLYIVKPQFTKKPKQEHNTPSDIKLTPCEDMITIETKQEILEVLYPKAKSIESDIVEDVSETKSCKSSSTCDTFKDVQNSSSDSSIQIEKKSEEVEKKSSKTQMKLKGKKSKENMCLIS